MNTYRPVMPQESWGRLSDSLNYYTDLGYLYRDVSWFVNPEINSITHPTTNTMVGSAEQGFLDLSLHGVIDYNKYVALTPCYREETVETPFHFKYFMKTELFKKCSSLDEANAHSEVMINSAMYFFKKNRNQNVRTISIVDTDIGKDIEINGIEVGSYGFRQHENIIWAYGTGLAEPRFTLAINSTGDQHA